MAKNAPSTHREPPNQSKRIGNHIVMPPSPDTDAGGNAHQGRCQEHGTGGEKEHSVVSDRIRNTVNLVVKHHKGEANQQRISQEGDKKPQIQRDLMKGCQPHSAVSPRHTGGTAQIDQQSDNSDHRTNSSP